MAKKKSAMLCDLKTMINCCIVLCFLVGLATLSFYRDYDQEEVSSNIKVSLSTTTIAITAKPKPNTHTHTHTNTNTTKVAQVFDNLRSIKVASPLNTNTTKVAQVFDNLRSRKVALPSLTKTCDLFSGQWVHDNKSHYPLYKENECPFMNGDLACQTYGRKDSKYQQWRWQPHGCDFPRFDGKAIVERLKDKRILFVGDSINRNQWVSITCMLYKLIPGKKKLGMGLNRTLYTFRVKDYNISVDYYWAPMLVESNGDDPSNHRHDYRAIRVRSIEKHARHWVDADILVFNTYLWWKLPIIKLLNGPGSLLGGPSQVYDEINYLRAYKMVLETWSKWVHSNIDPTKTKPFFMGPTTTHAKAKDWGGNVHKGCYKEKEPVMVNGFVESETDPKMLRILEASLSKLKAKGVSVQLIKITQLTQNRKDAHPSVHRKLWHPLSDAQKKNIHLASDCAHWCLPGVPDIWNELLLAYIFDQ